MGASLDIVYVVETDRPHDTDVEPEAEGAIERAAVAAKEFGIVADLRILAGDPEQVLVSEAHGHEADLVCLGPDGGLLGGAIRVGRVAKHVLGHASCSVMLARAAGATFPSKITCGVDGSEGSVQTASLAASIASARGLTKEMEHNVAIRV